MIRRLLILFALLLAPAIAEARGIEPQLVAEGPAPPGGEVELAIEMRTKPGWHGYWLNPGDAGLPMDVKWQLPPGYSVGPLRYPVPTRLTVAGIMNYVYEKDYAVLVRLKVPKDASGTVPIRASARWLACTDKICVPEQGAFALDVPVGAGPPTARQRFDEWRKALPRPLATPANVRDCGRHACASRSRCRAASRSRSPISSRRRMDRSTMPASSVSGGSDDLLIAELPRRSRRAAAVRRRAVATATGSGLEVRASRGEVPKGGRAIGDTGAQAILWAVLGAIARRIAAQPDAVRLPDPRPEGAASGEERRGRAHGTPRCDRLCGGRHYRDRCARRGAARDPRGGNARSAGRSSCRTRARSSCCAADDRDHVEPAARVRSAGGHARSLPSDSFGTGALAAFVATPCAGPFLGAALGTALLLPPAGSVAVFAALGLGSRAAVRCGRLHSSAAPPPAEARSLDGAPAALPRHPDGR